MPKFEWDNAKDAACYKLRGFGFSLASLAFDDRQRKIVPDIRQDYRELRFRCYGMIEGRLFVVVHTLRDRKIRIISARKGNARDLKIYAP
jgi:uncharacterized protein